MSYTEDRVVVIEDGVIVEVNSGDPGRADIEIDAAGRFVLPGLIDAHVHFRLATLDFRSLAQWSEVEFGIAMATLARRTVERGFTTVRDLGGEVNGLIGAIRREATPGPRIVRAGLMLTQTGGHGDAQGGPRAVPDCACSMHGDVFGLVADGTDAVRKGARHLLRDGSDFLKIHVSGGVASPSDPLESLQYTPGEVEAAVTEASHRGTYVAAHAYTPDAIAMAVTGGVHSIEHANLIDAKTAAALAGAGSVMVPTLVTYKGMNDHGKSFGMPATNLAKNRVIYESGLESVETAVAAGVTLGLGTDLIGELQSMQNLELALRAEVQPAADVLHSLWIVNARLCRLEGRVGVVAPHAFGDLIISEIDPLDDLAGFADHERSISHVIQAGIPVVDRST
jgi:imidazolonepropionase-like amidohydrolase